MQIMLLATDEEKTLPPLTDSIPSPMLPIANRPVMALMVEILARSRHKELLVSLCHRGEAITSYFGSGGRWGVHLKYVIQRQPWGSAGALKWASGVLNDTIVLLPTTAMLDLDVEAALAFHRAHQGMVTLILHTPFDATLPHPVQIDADGHVQGFEASVAAADGRVLCSTGAYIFEPDVLQYIPGRTPYACYEQLLPALLAAGVPIYGYQMHTYWNPLTSLQAYQQAQQVYLYSAFHAAMNPEQSVEPAMPYVRFPSIEGQQIAPGIWIGPNYIIHPHARLAPPLCIGENSRIANAVDLGPGSVLGANVVVDDEATVYQTTILDQTYVGRLVNLNNRIVHSTTLINPETAESIEVVDPFLLSVVQPVITRAERVHRLFDVSVTVCLLLLMMPLLMVISVLGCFALRGRVFQRSVCIGRRAVSPYLKSDQPADRQILRLWRFQTKRRDGTIPTFGQWLKRWEFDALPQLVNVLIGDLALVGVKPLSPSEVEHLQEEWHQKRSECPAGFTGLWYIQTEPDGDLDDILITDSYYAATRTRFGEIRILLQTPIAWLRRCRSQSGWKWSAGQSTEPVDTIHSP